MFGYKTRKIRELEHRLSDTQHEIERLRQLEQYGPLAADIAQRVITAVDNPEDFIAVNIDTILHSVESEYRTKLFLELFSRLPADRRMEFLLCTTQDPTAQNILQAALRREIQRVNDHEGIREILDIAKQERRIDIGQFAEGTTVDFYMYENEIIGPNMSPETLQEHKCVARIDTVYTGEGEFTIIATHLSDSGYKFINGLKDQLHGRIGTLIKGRIEPVIHFGTKLMYQVENEKVRSAKLEDDWEDKISIRIGSVYVDKLRAF